MDERDRQRLRDIVDAAEELEQTLHGLTLTQFRKAREKRRATERLMEIAGEAANNVSEDLRRQLAVDWVGLRRMRVLLAHAYHRVDPDIVWTAATQDLPTLAKAVNALLDKDR